MIALLPVTKQIFVFIDTFSLGLSAQFFPLFAHQKEYLLAFVSTNLFKTITKCWLLNICFADEVSLQPLHGRLGGFDCLLYLEVMIIYTKLSIREMKSSVNSVFFFTSVKLSSQTCQKQVIKKFQSICPHQTTLRYSSI